MKVFVATVESANRHRVEAAVAPITAALSAHSPRAVREASRAFVTGIRDFASAVCVLTESEWDTMLMSIRSGYREFCADFVLSASDFSALRQAVKDVPPSLQRIVSSVQDGDCLTWLPLDEEVLDGTGL